VRLFVALELPTIAREALGSLDIDETTWRVLKPETLHITLAFLGESPHAEQITPLITAHAGEPAPHLTLRRLLLLPPRKARVLTAELEAQGLSELQAGISGELEQAGVYTPEKRPFRPHVTVARLRPQTRAPRRADTHLEALSFHGTAITLYASRLHPRGARYEALATVPLAIP